MKTLLFLFLFFASAGTLSAQTRTLLYTAPCFSMRSWTIWDEVRQDSVIVRDCSPSTDSLHEPLFINLYKKPLGSGTFFTFFQTRTTLPCQPDSFPNQGPGHYYIIAGNSAGQSCGSGQVDLFPSVMTAVETSISLADPLVQMFDLQGRLVRPKDRLSSGIYFIRSKIQGRTVTKRILILR